MGEFTDYLATHELLYGIEEHVYPVPNKRMNQNKWGILLASIHSLISYVVIDKHLHRIGLEISDCTGGVTDPIVLIAALSLGEPVETELTGQRLQAEIIMAEAEDREPEIYRTSYLINGQYWESDDLKSLIFDFAYDSADHVIENNAEITKETVECAEAIFSEVFGPINNDDNSFEGEDEQWENK